LKPVSQKERITECVHVAAVLKNSFPFARGMNFCTRVSKKASFPEPPAQSTRPGAALLACMKARAGAALLIYV
jgi:hypothetical protein